MLIPECNVPFQFLALSPPWSITEISSADECGAEVGSIELLQQHFFALLRAESFRVLYGQPLFRLWVDSDVSLAGFAGASL
jgi:hypothetical protein